MSMKSEKTLLSKFNMDTDWQFASLYSRLIGGMIDSTIIIIIISIILSPIIALFSYTKLHNSDIAAIIFFALIILSPPVICWLYYALSESSKWHASLGKKILGMIVVNSDGTFLNFRDSTLRFLLKLFRAAPKWIDGILILTTSERQDLEDMVSNTHVLTKKKTLATKSS